MTHQLLRINAKYILPVSAPIIRNGSILVTDGKIRFIGEQNECPDNTPHQIFDYPNHLLMPGIVNSHTHLSLSYLKNKIKSGASFPYWIKKIISYTHAMTEEVEKNAIKEGINSLIASGTTTIGDISRSGFSMDIMQDMKVRGIVFFEIFGFKKSMKEEQENRIYKFLKSYKNDDLVKCGLSPHSPYSVSPQLIESAYHLSEAKYLPFAMHIAETKEEVEFIERGEGAFQKLLEDFGRWEPDWKPSQKTPIQYLENIGTLKGISGIHLNHINEKDIEIIKENNVSVIYCPKSNQWFQRENICPLMKLLENGINVALGTDSFASNNSLNMFEELFLIKKLFPDIGNESLLQMATINGAKALGLEDEVGSLEKGKWADILCLKVNNGDDIYKNIFSSNKELIFSMIGGKKVFPFS